MGFNDWVINGTIVVPPTTGRWMPRRALDQQGDNRPIYPGVRQFQMSWILQSFEDWAEVQSLYSAVEASGTSVVRIPGFPTADPQSYAFREYSGTTLNEPQTGPIFETYPSRVVLLINNIVVE